MLPGMNEPKKKKKSAGFTMDWQAKQEQERLQSERPEEKVKLLHPQNQAHMVVNHLRDDRNERPKTNPKTNTEFQTVAQVKERTHVDIGGNDNVRERLAGHPKIEWVGVDRLRYKVRRCFVLPPPPPRPAMPAGAPRPGSLPWTSLTRTHAGPQPEFDEIKNIGQLRELIMRFEFGIARERLEDCYAKAKVADDIDVGGPQPVTRPAQFCVHAVATCCSPNPLLLLCSPCPETGA